MRKSLFLGVSLLATVASHAWAQQSTTGVDNMIQQLAPGAVAPAEGPKVLPLEAATENAIIGRLAEPETRGVGDAPTAVRLPSPTYGHETEVLHAIKGRPTMQVAVAFQGESDALAVDAGALLGDLGKALNDPRLAGSRFLVGVYADSVGSDEYNLEVSRLRAKTIVGSLSTLHGVALERLTIAGFGRIREDEPESGARIRVVNLGPFAAIEPKSPALVAVARTPRIQIRHAQSHHAKAWYVLQVHRRVTAQRSVVVSAGNGDAPAPASVKTSTDSLLKSGGASGAGTGHGGW